MKTKAKKLCLLREGCNETGQKPQTSHAARLNNHVAYWDESSEETFYLGYATCSVQNEYVDAAFIKVTNPDVNMSASFRNWTTSTTPTAIAQGGTVYRSGFKTPISIGNVVSSSFALCISDGGGMYFYRDYVITNYLSDEGDSGGLTFGASGNIANPAGVHDISISGSLVSLGLGYMPSVLPQDRVEIAGVVENPGMYRGYCKISYVLSALGVSIIS